MRESPLAKFHRLRDAIFEATRAADKAGPAAFPVGATVHYEHGQNSCSATVVEYVGHGDVRVQGRTGKVYMLSGSRVTRVVV